MLAGNFNLYTYLQRIGHQGPVHADLATVAALMAGQLRSIPFENLDVRAGKGISLVPEDIFAKLIQRRRGGYCYEVNGLFAMVLTALGVDWRFVGCRPMTYPVRRPRTHMAILARFDGVEWLCDTGFGSYGLRAPIRLDERGEVEQDADVYRLLCGANGEYQLQARVEGEWTSQYGFDLSPQEWIDFLPANWLNSTHPETLFTQHRIVMRQTPEGRVTLFDNRLKVQVGGNLQIRDVDEAEVPGLLADTFGLENLP
ncbi:MAG: arylamine N-acetyltransferase [Pseudomonadota bacterium]